MVTIRWNISIVFERFGSWYLSLRIFHWEKSLQHRAQTNLYFCLINEKIEICLKNTRFLLSVIDAGNMLLGWMWLLLLVVVVRRKKKFVSNVIINELKLNVCVFVRMWMRSCYTLFVHYISMEIWYQYLVSLWTRRDVDIFKGEFFT